MTYALRFGVIGCGLVGQKRISSLPEHCILTTVYDPIVARAAECADLVMGPVEMASSEDELLTNSNVDAVIIATSHQSLSDVAVRALTHNKHVFIEKPGAISLKEIQRVQEAQRRRRSILRIGFNHRFHPSVILTRELVNSKKYGEMLWVRGQYGHGGRKGYETEWRARREVSGGGELLDQGSHLIDLVSFLFGDVSLDHSRLTTSFWAMDVEDNAFISLTSNSGGTAWLHASWTDWKNTFALEIALRTAKIEIRGLGKSYGQEKLTLYEMKPQMGPPECREWIWDGPDLSWKRELEDFQSAINGIEGVGANVDDAVKIHQIIAEAYSK